MKHQWRDDLTCSSCGRHRREVSKPIARPAVFICDERIGVCNDILTPEQMVAFDRPWRQLIDPGGGSRYLPAPT